MENKNRSLKKKSRNVDNFTITRPSSGKLLLSVETVKIDGSDYMKFWNFDLGLLILLFIYVYKYYYLFKYLS